jgi:hypothetical protein
VCRTLHPSDSRERASAARANSGKRGGIRAGARFYIISRDLFCSCVLYSTKAKRFNNEYIFLLTLSSCESVKLKFCVSWVTQRSASHPRKTRCARAVARALMRRAALPYPSLSFKIPRHKYLIKLGFFMLQSCRVERGTPVFSITSFIVLILFSCICSSSDFICVRIFL